MINSHERYNFELEASWLSWAAILSGLTLLVITYSTLTPALRLGDASGYLIMMFAWLEDLTPYTGPKGAAAYDAFIQSHRVLVPFYSWDFLHQQFGHLSDNTGGIDYHHFWFYSLLAALVYWPLSWSNISPVSAFPIMHLLLTGIAAYLIYRQHRASGVLSFFLLVLVSPAIWFITKIHTEYFTVVVGCVAVCYAMRRQFSLSSLWFAFASTQNPPFAIVAMLCLLLELWQGRTRHDRLWGSLSIAVCSLHPLYYYVRHGIVTPQLNEYEMSVDVEILTDPLYLSYVWVDPDVGLIANWPIVCLFAIIALLLLFPSYRRLFVHLELGWAFVVMVAISAAIFSLAHAITTNHHHGGTLSVTRYAMWYLPFLYVLLMVGLILLEGARKRYKLFVAIFVCAITFANLYVYKPSRLPLNGSPTPVSVLLYAVWPNLYDPIPEIFEERLRHTEATYRDTQWAISNPSGTKVLVYLDKLNSEPRPLKPVFGGLGLDPNKVAALAIEKQDNEQSTVYLNGMRSQISADPALHELNFSENLKIAFKGHYINKFLDPVMRRSWGEQ